MAAGMIEAPEENTNEATALRKTILWGIIANPVVTGKTITFRAIWVHYNTLGKAKGVIKFAKVIVENQGMFKIKGNFIFGVFDGEPIIR